MTFISYPLFNMAILLEHMDSIDPQVVFNIIQKELESADICIYNSLGHCVYDGMVMKGTYDRIIKFISDIEIPLTRAVLISGKSITRDNMANISDNLSSCKELNIKYLNAFSSTMSSKPEESVLILSGITKED